MTVRKLFLALVLVLSATVPGWSQGNTIMVKFAGAPSGTCSFIMLAINVAAPSLFFCPAGTWVAVGGSGSGTVNAGTTAQFAFYAANGTAISGGGPITTNVLAKGDATNALASSLATDSGTTLTYTGTGGLTTNGTGNQHTITQGTITTSAPFLTHTATWNAAGVAFTDQISNVTCTAAATASVAAGWGTAGTQWQLKYGGANCASPQILSPDGATANPVYSFSSATNTGIYNAGGNLIFTSVGADIFAVVSTSKVGQRALGVYEWSSTTTPATSFDTGISRTGPAVIAFGQGTQGDETGLLRWNTCKVSGDITLTVNTNITVCQWTLPSVAKTWGWQCRIPWVISAGSGTNTISIGVNAAQTPAATTTASATILTTNTGTQTNATVNLSASGAVNVLTSPTITPAATVFQSETFGTLSANATGGTFTITMNAAGTTATALAKAGATCLLY